ncbi:MAG: flavodoxin family protein [Methanomassiliicoccales archaeon]|nr:flavodoxin family protein [Methanomassiliicoccales archaeon]NYT15399.1 flavodoxin family protein [Methanomassiliicoccales archaeon]
MKVELYHSSKYGNGAMVAEEFREMMGTKGHQVGIHHINEVKPQGLAQADLYVFISPTRLGKPIGGMRRFLKKVALPAGTKYALIATHGAPEPNKKTGKMPTPEEVEKYQRTIPLMDDVLKPKGMVKVADVKIYVTGLKGPLEEGWREDLEAFMDRIIHTSGH